MNFSIFDSLLEPVFIIDANGLTLYCNEPAALILNSTPRKIIRQKTLLSQLLTFTPAWTALGQLAQLQEASHYEELFFASFEGKEGKAQLTVQPFESNYLVYFRDVTLEETLQKKYRGELEQKQGYIEKLEQAQKALEEYNKNLENTINERTFEIKALNLQMRALLDSLDQGFFIFDSEGTVLPVYSKACEKLLEISPAGKKIWDVVQIPENKVVGLQRWISTLFMEMLPFEDLAVLGPSNLINSKSRHIQFQFYPMLSAEGSLSGVVVVASDITDLLAAREDAEAQRERSRMIISLVENKKQAISFLKEADEILFKLQAELHDSWNSTEIYRHLHTLKGGAGSFAIREIVEQCHKMETIVTESKDAPDFKTHLLENFLTLQKLFANFEMNSTQLLGDRKHRDLRRAEVSEPEIIEFLQAHTPQTQWQPLHQQFENRFFFDDPAALVSGFAEMSKELAESQGKALQNFKVLAKDKRIDGQAWSPFLNNLVHVYRNAIDHGLETKTERLEAGKPEGGSITTSFNFDANLNQWQILIEDDGRGINAEKLKSKLVEKGLDLTGENESQILQHIFDPQVSTKDEVSEISGRGVGLDAVKAFVVSHGGSIVVHSKLGHGCRFEIWLPDLSSKAPVKMAA